MFTSSLETFLLRQRENSNCSLFCFSWESTCARDRQNACLRAWPAHAD